MKYSCLIYSEGGRDKKFLMSLIPLLEKYHARKWSFIYDNASGCSPETILEQCQKIQFIDVYKLVLCFIDRDKLKEDYPRTWEMEKIKLESKYQNFNIIWQIENAEDEYKKVLGDKHYKKHEINKLAKQNIEKFINSDFWKRIINPIKDKERELKATLSETPAPAPQ